MITKYDALIKAAQSTYLNGVDWRLFKAQLAQESALNPIAVSYVGAQGIAQFMPRTWQEVKNDLEYPNIATPF